MDTQENETIDHQQATSTNIQSQQKQQWKSKGRESIYSRDSGMFTSPISLETPITHTGVDPKLDDPTPTSTPTTDDPTPYPKFVENMKSYFEHISEPTSSSSSPVVVDPKLTPVGLGKNLDTLDQRLTHFELVSNQNLNEVVVDAKSDKSNNSNNIVPTQESITEIHNEGKSSVGPESINEINVYSELFTDGTNDFKTATTNTKDDQQSCGSSVYNKSVISNDMSAPTILIRRDQYREEKIDVEPTFRMATFSRSNTVYDPRKMINSHHLSSSINIDTYLKETIITEVSLSRDDVRSYSSSSNTADTYNFLTKKSVNELVYSPRKHTSLTQMSIPLERAPLTTPNLKNKNPLKKFFRKIFSSCLSQNEPSSC